MREDNQLVRGGYCLGQGIAVLAWLGVGVFMTRLLVMEFWNPRHHWLMVTFLVLWSLLWVFGGLYAMRCSWKKEQTRLASRRAYHSPRRLELRDDLYDLQHVKGQRFVTCIIGAYLIYTSVKDAEFNLWAVIVGAFFVYNCLRCRYLVKKIKRY